MTSRGEMEPHYPLIPDRVFDVIPPVVPGDPQQIDVVRRALIEGRYHGVHDPDGGRAWWHEQWDGYAPGFRPLTMAEMRDNSLPWLMFGLVGFGMILLGLLAIVAMVVSA